MYKKMNEYVSEFTTQLEEALSIALKFKPTENEEITNIVICGLGGSGIGATILSQLIIDECTVPITMSKEYDVPASVGENTLVIACSYSGNTEETLEAVHGAMIHGAFIVCVSSGGTLSEMAIEKGWPLITIPGGIPPRAAFAYSLVQLFRIVNAFGFIADTWIQELREAITHLNENESKMQEAARMLAESLKSHIPVIYTSAWLEGVGVRWRQQINENSKALAWTQPYPEMNHNELVGWRTVNHQLAVVFLTSDLDHERVAHRMELTAKVYRKYTPHIHHVAAEGESRLAQALYLIHLGDWMTVYLAEFRGFDSIEVEVIDWLKGELAKF